MIFGSLIPADNFAKTLQEESSLKTPSRLMDNGVDSTDLVQRRIPHLQMEVPNYEVRLQKG